MISEGVLLPQQLWNRHLELNDIDRYGNMFVSMNIPTVNDQDKFNLNVRRMYYDSSVSKVKFQSIGFEKFNYNTSGLSLSPSGTNCLFTSDMYGGFGMADLWFGTMQYNKEGKVSVQNYFNLGEAINTEKSDFDASFITENIIAFVSDGHMGFGGRDLYFFHLQTNRLINAGEYVNSRFDEFDITPSLKDYVNTRQNAISAVQKIRNYPNESSAINWIITDASTEAQEVRMRLYDKAYEIIAKEPLFMVVFDEVFSYELNRFGVTN